MWKIAQMVENVYKSLDLKQKCFKDLYDAVKLQIVCFTKQSSYDPKYFSDDSPISPIEETKEYEKDRDFEVKSESPVKLTDFSITSVYKEFFTKQKILGEKTSQIPSIIAPVYFGIRKIFVQEKMVSEKKNLFSKYTYKDFFCENDLDNDINPFSSENDDNFEEDVEELFKSTQEFIDKSKKVKVKKRRSNVMRMSASKMQRNDKNASIESPLSRDGGSSIGLKLPKLGLRKKRLNIGRLKRIGSSAFDKGQNEPIKASADAIMRQSLGTENYEQDYFSYLNSRKKSKKK